MCKRFKLEELEKKYNYTACCANCGKELKMNYISEALFKSFMQYPEGLKCSECKLPESIAIFEGD